MEEETYYEILNRMYFELGRISYGINSSCNALEVLVAKSQCPDVMRDFNHEIEYLRDLSIDLDPNKMKESLKNQYKG